MKFFTNKSIWSKIIILLVFIILFQFVISSPVQAGGEDVLEFGGKLLKPLLSLVVTLGDAVIGLIHSSVMGVNSSLQEVELSAEWYEYLGTFFKVVLATAVIIIGICVPGVGPLIAGIAAAFLIMFTGVGDVVFEGTMDIANVDGVEEVNLSAYTQANLPATLYLPAYSISPEEIFKGDILLFNVDFFSEPIEIKEEWGPVLDGDGNIKKNDQGEEIKEIKRYYYVDENGKEITTNPQNAAEVLGGTIAKWYVGIRNIALVLMMIVLLYIGIRILLSTLASDKAKYKQMLYDWFVGMMLLLLMHYIMAFSVTVVQKITDVVSTSIDAKGFVVLIPNDTNNKLVDYIKETGDQELIKTIVNGNLESDPDGDFVLYPTNLLGKMRLEAQLANWSTEYIGYAICFLVLVIYTIMFTFTYLRRVLYMAFLTIMAPMVALTYPIDKINDGSAQGFNKWFKEYIFNLLIQPMHLLLYYILVTSAFDLASESMIYSLVALGFMIAAEKLLRSFFGFEKATTPGGMGSAAGGALAMAGINKLAGALKGGSKGGKSSSGKGDSSNGNGNAEEENPSNVRFQKDFDDTEEMAGVDDGGRQPTQELPEQREQQEEQQEHQSPEQETHEQHQPSEQETHEEQQPQEQRTTDRLARDEQLRRVAIRKPKRNLRLRAARATRAGIYRASGRMVREAAGLARAAGGVAGGVIGAAPLAMAGLAAGIATGDPSKAFSYMSAGGAAGFMAGKGLGDKATEPLSRVKLADRADRAAQRVMTEDKYRQIDEDKELKKKRKEFKEALLDNHYSREQIKTMLDDGTINRYIKNDIDAKDAITIEKMRAADSNLTQTQGMAYAKYAKRVGDENKGTKRKEWKETFSDEFQDKAGKDKATADRLATETMKKIDAFKKAKKDVI